MKFTSFLVPAFLVISSTFIGAQVKYDFSLDVFNPLFTKYRWSLFYEISLQEDLGLENSLHINPETYQKHFTSGGNRGKQPLYYDFYLGWDSYLKWYLSKKNNNQGFFIGPANRLRFYLGAGDGYNEAFEEDFGTQPNREKLIWSLGGTSGYRFLIKDRIILSVQICSFMDVLPIRSYFSFRFFGYLKAGYRF